MKRILVIDESEAVRETLALILGRDFAVLKRPPAPGDLSIADISENVDLLICNVPTPFPAEAKSLLSIVGRLRCAVLFLVESVTEGRELATLVRVDFVTKPFNPYDLREKVRRLLAAREGGSNAANLSEPMGAPDLSRYLDYPFVTRSVADAARKFAATQLPILITGEIGCGQSFVCQAIHQAQERPGPLVTINAQDVNDTLIERKSWQFLTAYRQESRGTLRIENLDKASGQAQAALLKFVEQELRGAADIRVVSTANADMLARVYRGEFLDALYYDLATLTLALPALRDRPGDISALADWFAAAYAKSLGLGSCVFSEQAHARLSNYLWFGNLRELELVVARTLALHRKTRLEAADLVFDFDGEVRTEDGQPADFAEFKPFKPAANLTPVQSSLHGRSPAPSTNGGGHGRLPELNVVIHELAHELKNPMVTIKTFAQLLRDRYDDENFRARFQDVVGGDIDRMDDLLEMMIEFADFHQPQRDPVALEEKLRIAISEVANECAKRQTRILWTGNGTTCKILSDESQLAYILRNILFAVLAQTKMGSDIEVGVEREGSVIISYARDGGRIASLTHYLTGTAGHPNESVLPLRVLLAKQLVERNGGRLTVDQSDSDRDILRMEFAIGEYRKEN